MALKVTTTIINLSSMREWTDNGGEAEDFTELLSHVTRDLPVEVLSIETDGYYNVKCESGRIVVGISHWHLDGFDYNGPRDFITVEA